MRCVQTFDCCACSLTHPPIIKYAERQNLCMFTPHMHRKTATIHNVPEKCRKQRTDVWSENSVLNFFTYLHTLTPRLFISESAGHIRPVRTQHFRLIKLGLIKTCHSSRLDPRHTHTQTGIHTQQSPAQALTLGTISMTDAPWAEYWSCTAQPHTNTVQHILSAQYVPYRHFPVTNREINSFCKLLLDKRFSWVQNNL